MHVSPQCCPVNNTLGRLLLEALLRSVSQLLAGLKVSIGKDLIFDVLVLDVSARFLVPQKCAPKYRESIVN